MSEIAPMARLLPLLAFLTLNFGGLAVGARFTGPGVSSEWYQTLARAPWTPDGWAFGAAWTLIMVTFSIYMARLWSLTESSDRPILAIAYAKALAFNIVEPAFFGAQLTGWAMLDLILSGRRPAGCGTGDKPDMVRSRY